eukprot:COSAG06_NODE_3353_length_5471_cov_33.163068_6_plen_199_part_00
MQHAPGGRHSPPAVDGRETFRATSSFRTQTPASKLLLRGQGWGGPSPPPALSEASANRFSRSWARAPAPAPTPLPAATPVSAPGPAEAAAAAALGVSAHCSDEELLCAWQAKLKSSPLLRGSRPPRSRWQQHRVLASQPPSGGHRFVSRRPSVLRRLTPAKTSLSLQRLRCTPQRARRAAAADRLAGTNTAAAAQRDS